MWHRWQQPDGDPESWMAQPWDELGAQGGGFREVAVATDAAGRLTLVATSPNGRDLFQLTQVTPGGGWGSWSRLPSVPTEAAGPLLYLNRNGGLGLFLQAPDTGGLHQLIQPEPRRELDARPSMAAPVASKVTAGGPTWRTTVMWVVPGTTASRALGRPATSPATPPPTPSSVGGGIGCASTG